MIKIWLIMNLIFRMMKIINMMEAIKMIAKIKISKNQR